MENLVIRAFEQAIINFINTSEVPVEAKRLVLKDILNQVEVQAEEALKKEIAERDAAEQADAEQAAQNCEKEGVE